ncbi:MAG: helix-turn-helix transcriptional regulator [Alphaproteobacteria bacterium]|nr:helix-turn-helix transcriptional regulator [Alphaproteobacteria bacterium]
MTTERDMDALQANVGRASNLLRIMSNQWRLLILCNLAQSELSVCQLGEVVDLSQSALSQHLAILRQARLVKTRRKARSVYYSLASEGAGAVMQTLYALYCSDEAAEKQGCRFLSPAVCVHDKQFVH